MTLARVLIVHNAYQQKGGEDSVMQAEASLLRSRGHAVEVYLRHNDEILSMGRLSAARDAIWSRQTARDIEALTVSFRPDVIHVHNTLPLVSPAVFWVASKAGLPIVQTLHNFRLLCPQALLLRDGRVCEDCVGKLPWRGVAHGCYRGSRTQTAVVAFTNTVHRLAGTWDSKVTRYIALNEFARRKLVAGGLASDRIVVKPNFVDLPEAVADEPRQGLLYVGRLSEEKGVGVLLEAIRGLPPQVRVRVVGDGPMAQDVRAQARIEYLGPLSSEAVYAQMRRAQMLLLPSICYDNFPRTLVEAFACGLPVLASKLGALAELVEHERTGLHVAPADAQALAQRMAWAAEHAPDLAVMGQAARAHYEANWTAEANYRQLTAIYDEIRRP